MKLAVLSDVHGNVPALEAVLDDIERWGADQVVVNGDLVSRGPYSGACLRLLERQQPGARRIKGNHESWVLDCADRGLDPDAPTYELQRMAEWTCEQLGGDVERLRKWEEHVDISGLEGNSSVHVTHGSRLGNRDGIHPGVPEDKLPAKLGEPTDLFIGSHTHKPLTRRFNGTLVVNTGSVGQPFDDDPRAAYGRFTLRDGGWNAQIARVEFDKARAVQDFEESGFLDGAGPTARLIRLEVSECRTHVAHWRRRYMEAIKQRHITVAEAVEDYLRRL